MLSKSVAENVRRYREARGYSIRELARRSGVTHVGIAKIEACEVTPRVNTLEKLAGALSVSPKTLLNEPAHPRTATP